MFATLQDYVSASGGSDGGGATDAQIVLALLDLFSSESWFFFATSFHVDSSGGAEVAGGHVLRTQWPLGLFLREQEREQQQQQQQQRPRSKL